jgi:hypothetical protein
MSEAQQQPQVPSQQSQPQAPMQTQKVSDIIRSFRPAKVSLRLSSRLTHWSNCLHVERIGIQRIEARTLQLCDLIGF